MSGRALDRSTAVRRVLGGLLVANIAVLIAKTVIGAVAGSLAVMGDALHSSVDAVYNVLGLIVMRVAARAPDEEHPYGHGKFETLGALGLCVFLSITCFELLRSAISRLATGGHTVQITDLGLVLLLATLATNVFVAWYENRRGQQLASELLIADAAHTRTDVLITIGVLIGVLLSRGGNAGSRYAEVTIAVDPNANVAAAHAIADAVEEKLKKELELEEVTVHVEPC